MHYRFTFPNRVSRFAVIELALDELNGHQAELFLPAWRPGRYELGNFARNIRSFKVFSPDGDQLLHRKISKDSWLIELEGHTGIQVVYEYYCAQPDAGACWIDEELVYINPVHCCMYLQERISAPCTVTLELPNDYSIACSMASPKHGVFHAKSFHELVDSPWMASANLQHGTYAVDQTDFHVWFHGNVVPDWPKVLDDFTRFSEVQLQMMGGLPVREYHSSTVLALGPAGQLMESPRYEDLTGVASHELFHVWNIKAIRPLDMLPYDYSAENYSRLGFVYEGVTTYYGDLFLVRSGVYSHEQYLMELDLRLQKHFATHARFNMPVADASFDTWLDGYVPGIPHRKTSIYDEGSLVALMTDLLIRRNTQNKASLDDVMRALYNDFGKRNIGYTESDYLKLVGQVAGMPMADFFADYVYGTENYEPLLRELLDYVGCELTRNSSTVSYEHRFGFKANSDKSCTKVIAVLPGSIADRAGLGKDDEVIAVNEIKVEGNLAELIPFEESDDVVLTILTPMKRMKDILLATAPESYYHNYSIQIKQEMSTAQQANLSAWLS
jgi:predicted metalloprotease with PDZ domain